MSVPFDLFNVYHMLKPDNQSLTIRSHHLSSLTFYLKVLYQFIPFTSRLRGAATTTASTAAATTAVTKCRSIFWRFYLFTYTYCDILAYFVQQVLQISFRDFESCHFIMHIHRPFRCTNLFHNLIKIRMISPKALNILIMFFYIYKSLNKLLCLFIFI